MKATRALISSSTFMLGIRDRRSTARPCSERSGGEIRRPVDGHTVTVQEASREKVKPVHWPNPRRSDGASATASTWRVTVPLPDLHQRSIGMAGGCARWLSGWRAAARPAAAKAVSLSCGWSSWCSLLCSRWLGVLTRLLGRYTSLPQPAGRRNCHYRLCRGFRRWPSYSRAPLAARAGAELRRLAQGGRRSTRGGSPGFRPGAVRSAAIGLATTSRRLRRGPGGSGDRCFAA